MANIYAIALLLFVVDFHCVTSTTVKKEDLDDGPDLIIKIDKNGKTHVKKEPQDPWDNVNHEKSVHASKLRRVPRNAIATDVLCSYRWTDATLYYTYGPDASKDVLKPYVDEALARWEEYTCIQFIDITDDAAKQATNEYVQIGADDDGGCYATIGMSCGPGSQTMNLPGACENTPLIMHEFAHALGLFHHHTRPDRDNYVEIDKNNMDESEEAQFELEEDSLTYGSPYDYYSIVHYGKTTFSNNKKATIRTKNPSYQFVIGSPPDASHSDKMTLNAMYDCAAHCTSPPTCQNDGFVNKDCECECPHNTEGDNCETVTGPYVEPFYKDCGNPVISSDMTFTSLNYPDTRSDAKCLWCLMAPAGKKVKITFTEFNLYDHKKCKVDYVEIYQDLYNAEERYCGEDLAGVTIEATDNSICMLWRTGYDGGDTGFSANAEFVDTGAPTTTPPPPSPPAPTPPPGPTPPPKPKKCFLKKKLFKKFKSLLIKSTDFPKENGKLGCKWIFELKKKKTCLDLLIYDLDIPQSKKCSKAYLELKGDGKGGKKKKICYKISSRNQTKFKYGRHLNIKLRVNTSGSSYKGFRAALKGRHCNPYKAKNSKGRKKIKKNKKSKGKKKGKKSKGKKSKGKKKSGI